jgi:hypothetical protein
MITYQPDLSSFYKANHKDVQAIFEVLGIKDRDRKHDLSQDFYVQVPYIIAHYDRSKSSFSTYVFTCIKYFLCTYYKTVKPVACELTDRIPDRSSMVEVRVRIDDFKRFLRRYNMRCLGNMLAEIDDRITMETPYFKHTPKVNHSTYDKFRKIYNDLEEDREIDTESKSLNKTEVGSPEWLLWKVNTVPGITIEQLTKEIEEYRANQRSAEDKA